MNSIELRGGNKEDELRQLDNFLTALRASVAEEISAGRLVTMTIDHDSLHGEPDGPIIDYAIGGTSYGIHFGSMAVKRVRR
jgi:hypothetical protein